MKQETKSYQCIWNSSITVIDCYLPHQCHLYIEYANITMHTNITFDSLPASPIFAMYHLTTYRSFHALDGQFPHPRNASILNKNYSTNLPSFAIRSPISSSCRITNTVYPIRSSVSRFTLSSSFIESLS